MAEMTEVADCDDSSEANKVFLQVGDWVSDTGWLLGTGIGYQILGTGYLVPEHPDSSPTSWQPGCFGPGPYPNILA